MSASLSKSGYLAALQCPRRLWLEAHAPERAAPPDGITTAIRDEARAIGRAQPRHQRAADQEQDRAKPQVSVQRTPPRGTP